MRLSSEPYDITALISSEQRGIICDFLMKSSTLIALPSSVPGRLLFRDNLTVSVCLLSSALFAAGVHSVCCKSFGMKLYLPLFFKWMQSINLSSEYLRFGMFDFGRTFPAKSIIAFKQTELSRNGFHKTNYSMFRISESNTGGFNLRATTTSSDTSIFNIKLYSHVVHTMKSALNVSVLW